ncbi:hypothetical protein K474DRAFT_1670812 [Panus rudis PR-1116 ss-1]|nr:hypothetical protein K474DRAFT_1670812 [Panus rudis PR-1116 ss-1]
MRESAKNVCSLSTQRPFTVTGCQSTDRLQQLDRAPRCATDQNTARPTCARRAQTRPCSNFSKSPDILTSLDCVRGRRPASLDTYIILSPPFATAILPFPYSLTISLPTPELSLTV